MTWPEDVRKSDLRIEYYRGSGKGGQHRNKRDTACRITHKETGISACAEEHKSQAQNRKAAFLRLTKKLIPLMRKAYKAEGGSPHSVSRERVRTYHEPRQEVKDHRIPDRVWSYQDVLSGHGLEEIIDTLQEEDFEWVK